MNTEKQFVKIAEASKITGCSQYYLRNRVREGSLPALKSGTTYLINLSAMLQILDRESRGEA